MEMLAGAAAGVRARTRWRALMAAIAAAMMILVAWQSARCAFDQWDESMASVEASAAWFIVPLAVGCGAFGALHLVVDLLPRHGVGRPQP